MTQRSNAYPELERDLRFFPLGVDQPAHLTSKQVEQYNEKGYVFPVDIFSQSEIESIRSYFDELLPKALEAGWNSYELTNWHKHCRGVWDIVTDSRIIDVMEDMLGETVILRHSHFFAKLPGDGMRVSWHQDASYWPLTPSKVVSAWLAIDDVDLGNGAMQVIPGSHLRAQVEFRDSTADEHNVLNQTVENPEEHGDPPVALELQGGTDLVAQRLGAARLGAERIESQALRLGDALSVQGCPGLQRLERQLNHLPRRGADRALGQSSASGGGTDSGERGDRGSDLGQHGAARWQRVRPLADDPILRPGVVASSQETTATCSTPCRPLDR